MKKLSKWLTDNGWSKGDLASAIKTHASTVTRLLNGDTKDPAVSIAVAIEDVTGGHVKCRDWVPKGK